MVGYHNDCDWSVFTKSMKTWQIVPLIFIVGLAITGTYAFQNGWYTVNDAAREYQMYLSHLENGYTKTFADAEAIGLGLQVRCFFTTLFPALLQSVLKVDPLLFYKLYTVVLVSLLPVGIFAVAVQFVDKKWAVIASGLVMGQTAFLQAPSMARTIIAVTFFAFIIAVLYHFKAKWYVYPIVAGLCTGIVFSHYTTLIVSIVILGVGLVFMIFNKSVLWRSTMVALVVMISFGVPWYYKPLTHPIAQLVKTFELQTVETILARTKTVNDGDVNKEVAINSNDGDSEDRDKVIQVAFGNPTPDGDSNFHFNITLWVLSWLMIVITCLGLALSFIKKLLPKSYIVMGMVCICWLGLFVIAPYISRAYGVERLWMNGLVILAPMFVIGLKFLTQWAKSYQIPIALIYILALGVLNYNFGVIWSALGI